MKPDQELTEEDIQQELSGEAVKGPRVFKGELLAPWKLSFRDIIWKCSPMDDTPQMASAVGMKVLGMAYVDDPKNEYAVRMNLIRETDDVNGFRTKVSIWLDDWTQEDFEECARLISEIQRPARLAEVTTVSIEKKREADAPLQMTTSSPA